MGPAYKGVNQTGLFVCFLSGMTTNLGGYCINKAMGAPGADAGTVASLSAMYPTVTLVLAVLFFGEYLTFNKVVAVLLAMASAYFFSQG